MAFSFDNFSVLKVMTALSKINFTRIGYFLKSHGVSGTLMLVFEEGLEDTIENSKVLFVETDGILIPWFVSDDGIRIISSKSALVDLDWITDEQTAKKLLRKPVWINNITEFYHPLQNPESLDGYAVYDHNKGYIGQISEINDYSGNLVITLINGNNEILLPLHDDLISNIDEANRSVTFNLPDGITEI